MSNKETLQGYNKTLNQYNTNLDDILNTINNLPENENLTEELDIYNNEVTEQEVTIDTILKTLQHKAIGGGTNEPDEPVVEPDYITDGLVAWWEGCDGLDSNGHWCSRVGNDYIYLYTTTPDSINGYENKPETIKSNSSYRNNMVYSFITNEDYHTQGYTFEIVGKINTTATSNNLTNHSSSGGTLLGFDRSLSPVIQIYGSDGTFGVFNSKIMDNLTTKYINCVGKRYKYTISLDKIPPRVTGENAIRGEHLVSYSLNGDGWSTNNLMNIGASSKGSNLTLLTYYKESYMANGEICSIRIYNRKLTEEELRHNYEIDKARFEIDDYETA